MSELWVWVSIIVNDHFVKRDGQATGVMAGVPIRYPVEAKGRHEPATTQQWLRTFTIDDGALTSPGR